MLHLRFNGGSLIIRGDVGTPYGRWDPRVEAFRAMALHYPEVLEYLDRSRLLYRDEVADPLPVPPLRSGVELRPYQGEALEAWLDAGRRGVIELPTGAGKTYIALKAMERLNVATLVVIPTLDLVDQWRSQLERLFKVEVGVMGGGEAVLRQLRMVEGVDMIVAADRAHACQQLDRLRRKLDIVYYKGKVPLRPVLNHLRAREDELRQRQLEQIRGQELKIEAPVVTAAELALRLGVLEEAVMENLRHRDIPGYQMLGDVLVSDSTLEEIGKRLDERMGEDVLTLNEAAELVEELGGARPSRVLEHLGYRIEWHGINPEKAEVHRKQTK